MATYQEQIAKYEEASATKALVAMAELGTIGDALAMLQRDGIITADDRILFCRAFVMKHPEINERLAKYRAEVSDAASNRQEEKP